MSIDGLLNRRFNRNEYQCAHFTAEAWAYLVGDDLKPALSGLLRPVKDKVVDPRELRRHFKQIDKPVHPCIVLMLKKGQSPHIGVFWKGRILHLTEKGVRYQPKEIASLGFNKLKYYKWQPL